jgi:hypothetical protein
MTNKLIGVAFLLVACPALIAPAAAQENYPISGGPITITQPSYGPPPSSQLPGSQLPYASVTCQPGQVLNAVGNACQPSESLQALPQTNPSLLGPVPSDLTFTPGAPQPLFFNGTNCPSGQVLQANGQAC